MSTETYDVIIAGAGPAGVAVAARLAQKGRAKNILVLDRYHFPRDKPCGGALTGHVGPAMDALGLSLRVEHVPCPDAVVRCGSFERRVEMGQNVDVIRRLDFDADLVAQARERGIRVIEGEGLTSYEVQGDCVLVHTSEKRTLRAKVLVGADGAASRVRKQILCNAKATPHRLFVAELNVPAPEGLATSMVYDFTLMKRGLCGYVWLFPAPGGRLNVGLMHYPNPSKNLSGRELTELLREGLAPYGVELPGKCAKGWPVWGYHPNAKISESRVLTVGDAAGIDGLTGEGIAVAMEQAVVAGDEIHLALDNHDFEFSGYRKSIRRATVGRELALDRWLAKLLYGTKRWRDWLALVLLDEKVLDMYARRVDGTEVLADQRLGLYGALCKHSIVRGRRLRRLAEHLAEWRPLGRSGS
ncbi:MAG: geranylgeranyl reductase family protein [Myxococcales bacterium]|nr:geranylgeranyl reductase family protein [Myxococcales bacterium]